MKKAVVLLVLSVLLTSSVFAQDVHVPIYPYAYDKNMPTFLNVGNGYIMFDNKSTFFSHDFANWRPISIEHSKYTNYGVFIWTGSVYLTRSIEYDTINHATRSKPVGMLCVLDENFKLLKEIAFDDYIKAMTYVDGTCYVKTNSFWVNLNTSSEVREPEIIRIFSSTDFENWTERTDLTHVPITNGQIGLMSNELEVSAFVDGAVSTGIVYENVPTTQYRNSQMLSNYVNPYFVIIDRNKFDFEDKPWFEMTKEEQNIINNRTSVDYKILLSKDGIYYTSFWVYELGYSIDSVEVVGDKLMVNYYMADRGKSFYFNISDIESKLTDCDTYIKLNDKILGFDVAPVVEDDRILVPMRFLFEQMGADVEWNNDTQTATVKQASKEVAFSVNSATAKVNDAAKTMDVPARLIDGKTMVPLRFLSEELGYTVEWDEATNTAIIKN